jgi:hypothetical protein
MAGVKKDTVMEMPKCSGIISKYTKELTARKAIGGNGKVRNLLECNSEVT